MFKSADHNPRIQGLKALSHLLTTVESPQTDQLPRNLLLPWTNPYPQNSTAYRTPRAVLQEWSTVSTQVDSPGIGSLDEGRHWISNPKLRI